jgi:hypothetical protein
MFFLLFNLNYFISIQIHVFCFFPTLDNCFNLILFRYNFLFFSCSKQKPRKVRINLSIGLQRRITSFLYNYPLKLSKPDILVSNRPGGKGLTWKDSRN